MSGILPIEGAGSTTMISDSYIMPFGKHKGETIGSVPAGYLDWLMGQSWVIRYPKIRQYVLGNREHIDRELEQEEWRVERYDNSWPRR